MAFFSRRVPRKDLFSSRLLSSRLVEIPVALLEVEFRYLKRPHDRLIWGRLLPPAPLSKAGAAIDVVILQ